MLVRLAQQNSAAQIRSQKMKVEQHSSLKSVMMRMRLRPCRGGCEKKLVFVGDCLMIFDTGTTTEGHSKASCAWATRHQAKVAPQSQEQNSCRIQVDVFRSMQAAKCAESCPERSAGRVTCTRNDEEQRTHTAKAATQCRHIFLGNSRWKGSR